jgi:hypothetical protein
MMPFQLSVKLHAKVILIGWWVRICKEAVVAYLQLLSKHSSLETEESSGNIQVLSCAVTKIPNGFHLSNTLVERYRYTSLLGVF